MADMLRSERSGNFSVWVRVPPSVPYGSVAQWIVQQISTLRVVGSNPTAFTKGEDSNPTAFSKEEHSEFSFSTKLWSVNPEGPGAAR